MRMDFHAVQAFASGDDETPITTKYFKDWYNANEYARKQAKKYNRGSVKFEALYTKDGCDYKEHKWVDWVDYWSNKE